MNLKDLGFMQGSSEVTPNNATDYAQFGYSYPQSKII